MKRWMVVAGLALAVGLAVGGISVAASRDHGISKKTTLAFLDVTVSEDFVDVGEPAQNPGDVSSGDTFFFHDELWNLAETKKRGTVDGSCTFLIDPTVHCAVTVFLAGGTVEVAGGVRFTEPAAETESFAVTGGTGRYENVVGEAKVTETGEEGRSRLVLELIPSFRRP